MALDRTKADAVLKEFYLDPLRNQLNLATPFLAEVDRDSEHVEGRTAYLALHTGRNEGVGARSETGTLPTAQNQVSDKSTFDVKYTRYASALSN